MYKALNEAKSGLTFNTMVGMAKGTINAATGYKKSGQDGEYSYSSIAKAASKMVAVFPVLTSRTVSAETAQMVSKYIEQKMCSLFVLALQQANISTAKNGIEYLRQYHQNLDNSDDVNAILKTMDSWLGAYNTANESTLSSYMAEADIDSLLESDMDLQISGRDMMEIMKIMQEQSEIEVYDTQLNPVSINDFMVREFANGDYHVSIKAITEANNSDDDEEREYRRRKRQREENDYYASRARDYKREREHDEDREQSKKDRIQDREERRQDREERTRRAAEEQRARTSSGSNVSLKDFDVKKMNDAVPSMLVVRFYSLYKDDNGTLHQSTVPTEFIIGVKSKLIPVTTDEILRRIMNDNKDGKKFLKFMRLMTHELKLSEVLFGFSQIKDDVKSTKKKGAQGRIWNLLANRAQASSEAVKHGTHNDFSAISTVVISQNDVDELFHEENFDISDPKNALHFMQSYNLISFVITDDATEVVKILMDDGSKSFEEYAYRMFDRETKDGTYKKLINLMAASK